KLREREVGHHIEAARQRNGNPPLSCRNYVERSCSLEHNVRSKRVRDLSYAIPKHDGDRGLLRIQFWWYREVKAHGLYRGWRQVSSECGPQPEISDAQRKGQDCDHIHDDSHKR